jgi:SprT protein
LTPPSAGTEELQSQARDLTARLLGRAAAAHRIPLPEVAVRFDLRGTQAGQARMLGSRRFLIRYNPDLLARHNQGFLERTVPHEVAHVIIELMGFFGASPERCHNFDTGGLSQRTLQRFRYHCGCGEHELSSIRHRRHQTGTIYRCRACSEALRPG